MAEVFGAVAGVVGIIDAGTRLGGKIRSMRRRWRAAPTELETLQYEVEDISSLFDMMQNVWALVPRAAGEDKLGASLSRATEDFHANLGHVERFLDRMDRLTERQRKAAWIRQKSEAEMKMGELGRLRGRIMEILQLCQLAVSPRMHNEIITNIYQLQQSQEHRQRQQTQQLQLMQEQRQLQEQVKSPRLSNTALVETVRMRRFRPTSQPLSDADIPPDTPLPAARINWGAYRNPYVACDDSCACLCHRAVDQRTIWLKTPKVLGGLFGMLLASSSSSRACSIQTCRRRPTTNLQLRYNAPRWMVSWSAEALVKRQAGKPPLSMLRFRPRVGPYPGGILDGAVSGSLHVVQKCIQEDPECVHERYDTTGKSALAVVSSRGADELRSLTQTLLRAGADIWDEDDNGIPSAATFAMMALIGSWAPGMTKAVSSLFPMTRIVDELDLSPITKIILGLQDGDLWSNVANLPVWCHIDDMDGTGQAPIHWAALLGRAETVQQLILGGADVNQKTYEQLTPLMVTAGCVNEEKSVECALLLLDAGADLSATDSQGRNSLHAASSSGNAALLRFLLQQQAIDIEAGDQYGYTALHSACALGRINAARILLDAGSDVNATSPMGRTPLMAAIINNRMNSCQFLISAGADCTRFLEEDWSILHFAASCADEFVMGVLANSLPREAGQLIYTKNKEGMTPEMLFHDRKWRTEDLNQAFQSLSEVCKRYTETLEEVSDDWYTADEDTDSDLGDLDRGEKAAGYKDISYSSVTNLGSDL